jgi:hypothetical protein
MRVPIIELVIGVCFYRIPRAVAGEAVEGREITHREIAGIGVTGTSRETGRVPPAEAAGNGFISKDRVDDGGGGCVKSVAGPAFVGL